MEVNEERASEKYQDKKSHVGWEQRMPQGEKGQMKTLFFSCFSWEYCP